MKIFLDTEFYEYPPLAVRDREFIDTPGANAVQLISIGAVREDGKEFYAENSEFSWEDIPDHHWLQANVRPHLTGGTEWSADAWSMLGNHFVKGGCWAPSEIAWNFRRFATNEFSNPKDKPEFWGYFCDYDWVVLCGLYGRMVDLPPEFPMFCLDLKQEMVRSHVDRHDLPVQDSTAHHALEDARWIRDAFVQTRVINGREFAE